MKVYYVLLFGVICHVGRTAIFNKCSITNAIKVCKNLPGLGAAENCCDYDPTDGQQLVACCLKGACLKGYTTDCCKKCQKLTLNSQDECSSIPYNNPEHVSGLNQCCKLGTGDQSEKIVATQCCVTLKPPGIGGRVLCDKDFTVENCY